MREGICLGRMHLKEEAHKDKLQQEENFAV